MRQREGLLKDRVLKDLRALPRTFCEKISQVATRGTPDILGCMNGFFFALELKRDLKAHTDELQKHKLWLISEAGGFSALVCPENWDATRALMVERFLPGHELKRREKCSKRTS